MRAQLGKLRSRKIIIFTNMATEITYTEKDIYEGMLLRSGDGDYQIGNIRDNKCSLTNIRQNYTHSNYPLTAILFGLNNPSSWKEVKIDYQIY